MIRNTGEVIMSFLGKCSQEVADYVMTIDDPSTQRKLLILHVVPNMQVSV
ncbi:MAG: hypothetical protein NZL83_02285 [Candidatus Absconditabacterales bacterium]|nr:hypothetical protein [Candidatus Absconditabacterales bacterium]